MVASGNGLAVDQISAVVLFTKEQSVLLKHSNVPQPRLKFRVFADMSIVDES